ncbi:hypothetical protein C8R42DRAFT_706637 [Lentinula raphanica]|nr:hypothetical protein C8R42DRAFT_706637 [Lentinula raphanica]
MLFSYQGQVGCCVLCYSSGWTYHSCERYRTRFSNLIRRGLDRVLHVCLRILTLTFDLESEFFDRESVGIKIRGLLSLPKADNVYLLTLRVEVYRRITLIDHIGSELIKMMGDVDNEKRFARQGFMHTIAFLVERVKQIAQKKIVSTRNRKAQVAVVWSLVGLVKSTEVFGIWAYANKRTISEKNFCGSSTVRASTVQFRQAGTRQPLFRLFTNVKDCILL